MTKSPCAVIAIDLDGTFYEVDFFQYLFQNWLKKPFLWRKGCQIFFQKGYPAWKCFLESEISIPLQNYSPRESLLKTLWEAKQKGCLLVLITGSPDFLAKRIQRQFPELLDEAFGTTPEVNLVASRKAAFLKRHYPQGFCYVGNSFQDLPVWKAAQEAWVCSSSRLLLYCASRMARVTRIF